MAIKVTKPSINIREALSDLKQDTGLKGQELMRADTVAEARTLIGAGRKNLIINGGFDVWQRGTSFTPTLSTQVYTADRIGAYGADVVTLSRSTDVPNGTFKYSLKGVCDTVSTASGEFVIPLRLQLEGNSITSTGWGTTSGQDLTLSFYMKSNKVGTYGAQITNVTQSHSYHIEWSVTSSWQKFTFTIPKPPTSTWDLGENTRGIDIQFGWGNGSTYKVGVADSTWSTTTNAHSTTNQVSFLDSTSNYFHITGVQLELGSVATDFEHRSYGEELALCQRYYTEINFSVQGYQGANNFASSHHAWQQTMRAQPSTTKIDGNVLNVTNTTMQDLTTYGLRVEIKATSAGRSLVWTGSIKADAEL
jgi:hypothetical protein